MESALKYRVKECTLEEEMERASETKAVAIEPVAPFHRPPTRFAGP